MADHKKRAVNLLNGMTALIEEPAKTSHLDNR